MTVSKIEQALEMWELGVAMRRQRFRREYPGANESEIDGFVQKWLESRPGTRSGDGPGRVRHVVTP